MEVDRHFYEAPQDKEFPQGQVHVPLPSHSTPCLTNGEALANHENGYFNLNYYGKWRVITAVTPGSN